MLIVGRTSSGEAPSQDRIMQALLALGADLCTHPDVCLANRDAVGEAAKWVVEDLFPRLYGSEESVMPCPEYFADTAQVESDLTQLAALLDNLVDGLPGRGDVFETENGVVLVWAGAVSPDEEEMLDAMFTSSSDTTVVSRPQA